MSSLQPIFRVSEFNEAINLHLELLGPVVVEGEIGSLNIREHKWAFLTLKDDKSAVEVFTIVYQVPAIYNFEPGMKVQVSGIPRVHQRSGRFSLKAHKIVPAGEGALKLAAEKLKRRLEQEGLFDPSHKRQLPTIPEHIGLITATDSQAFHDFVKVSRQRLPFIKLTHFPVNVQGNQAVETIVEAITKANTKAEFDVLVVTRGGGSAEDLAAFNDELLVRSVFGSKTPIVCAIGHEGDVSLVELAADLRASTPSNAAELIVPTSGQLSQDLYLLVNRGQRRVEHNYRQQLSQVSSLTYRLDKALSHQVWFFQQQLRRYQQLTKTFHYRLRVLKQRLTQQGSRYRIQIKRLTQDSWQKISSLNQRLENLDIKKVLNRGFSLTRGPDGQVITSINQVAPAALITTSLSDGTIESHVQTNKPSDAKKN